MTSFISRLPPSEARGLREVNAPRITDRAGRASKYSTTIKSPANVPPGSSIARHKIIDEKTDADGGGVTILAEAEVCNGGACVNTLQTATVCKAEQGWRVCQFVESPGD